MVVRVLFWEFQKHCLKVYINGRDFEADVYTVLKFCNHINYVKVAYTFILNFFNKSVLSMTF